MTLLATIAPEEGRAPSRKRARKAQSPCFTAILRRLREAASPLCCSTNGFAGVARLRTATGTWVRREAAFVLFSHRLEQHCVPVKFKKLLLTTREGTNVH